ncbi:MAG: hypothetical protein ACE37B_17695 [Ilumatobacter sp.]|uniref:hypothetical protein n=1 Tax=Ilumatobacter sp. TaxID=1967498 RepID=UPI0039199310
MWVGSRAGVALAAAVRSHDLTESEASAAADEWEIFWSSMRPIELEALEHLLPGRPIAPPAT